MQITKEYFDQTLTQHTKDIIGHFNRALGQVRSEMSVIKKDVSILKDDVCVLKDDMGKVKSALEDYLHTDEMVCVMADELINDHHLALPRTSQLLAK